MVAARSVDRRGRATQLAERRPSDAPSTAVAKPPLHWLLVGWFRDRRRDGPGTTKDDLYVRLEPALFGANTYGVAHPVQASRPGLSSGHRRAHHRRPLYGPVAVHADRGHHKRAAPDPGANLPTTLQR